MRWYYLAGVFPILILAVYLVWMHRFERIEQVPSVGLEQIQAGTPEIEGFRWSSIDGNPTLRVERGNSASPPAGHLRLPRFPAIHSLHIRFRLNASNLVPGPEKWEDGRLLLEWHDPDPACSTARNHPTTYISSARLTSVSGIVDFVVPSPIGPAIPVLRIENLGRSGAVELKDLEITAVRESVLWKFGKWACFIAWTTWMAYLVTSLSCAGAARAIFVAIGWVSMAAHFVVPGPWQNPRPFISAFHLTQDFSTPRIPEPQLQPLIPTGPSSGSVAALGKLKDEGSYALRIKMWLAPLRPILHALLLGIPALGIALLVGRKTAWFVMILLALLIEAAQVAFGFGFDVIDLADLLFDLTGIFSGLWLGRWFVKYLPIRVRALLHQSMVGPSASSPSAESALLLQKG